MTEKSSAFSEFIRNASPEEKERVYNKVIDGAIEDQNHVIARAALSPASETPSGMSMMHTLIAGTRQDNAQDATPLTDLELAANGRFLTDIRDPYVRADFARTLERQLAEQVKFTQGYYNEASIGWSKFRETERALAAAQEELKKRKAHPKGLSIFP